MTPASLPPDSTRRSPTHTSSEAEEISSTPPAVVAASTDSRRARAQAFFGLTPEIIAVSTAMLLMNLGENLWRRFLPKYLQSLGAPIAAIGLFGTAEDFLDGVYQYPGGWIADRYGRRRALMLFVLLTIVGYALFAVLPSWPVAFLALAFTMAWDAMASPTLFAVVGDALPRQKRTMGFTVQSILRRVPIVVAPALGGVAIAHLGLRRGMQFGLAISIALAVVTLLAAARVRIPIIGDEKTINFRHVWHSFPDPLRWLLASDVFIRTCEGMVDVFLVLYAINIIGISAPQFGILIAVQAATAMLVYIPAARIAEHTGKKPFVIATFCCFALMPLAVVWARGFSSLVLAFAIGGLREVGEPARKALIIDLAVPSLRARVVGLYYFVRSLTIAPAAFVGGLLWRLSPELPFYIAGAIGAAGVVVFTRTVDEQHA